MRFLVIPIFALYIFINALIRLVDIILRRRDGDDNLIYKIIVFTAYLLFGVILLFMPALSVGLLVLSFLFYGIAFIVFPKISSPVIISTFMLPKYIKKISKEYNGRPADYAPPDMEILIHLRKGGRLGHCDVVFDGRVVSYGNYDKETYKWGRTFGQGIFFTADRDKYLKFCADYDNKTTVCYGLRLNPEGVDKAKEELAKILKQSYPWKPAFQQTREIDSSAPYSDELDYCSKLWFSADCNFRKFHSGVFKSYFAFSKNCVLLTGQILKTGSGGVKPNGVILTPGKLFNYLERLLKIKDSMVFSRKIYNSGTHEEDQQDRWDEK